MVYRGEALEFFLWMLVLLLVPVLNQYWKSSKLLKPQTLPERGRLTVIHRLAKGELGGKALVSQSESVPKTE